MTRDYLVSRLTTFGEWCGIWHIVVPLLEEGRCRELLYATDTPAALPLHSSAQIIERLPAPNCGTSRLCGSPPGMQPYEVPTGLCNTLRALVRAQGA